MRLKCPNCDAQYEVPDEVIPADGRDVQCSNCGQTWFQGHASGAPSDLDDDLDDLYDEDGADDDPDEEVEYEDEAEPEPAPAPQPRRSLDPAVADILRKEAEHETQVRRAAAGGLESQPDLGLEQPDATGEAARRSREARERMARIRGEEPHAPQVSEAAATAAAVGSRRDLLPDIEEINSTLRSSSDRVANGDPTEIAAVEERQKKGARRGFLLSLLIAVCLALVYIYAPQIAEAVPGADPWINSYVAYVDQGRIWLDGKFEGLLNWLEEAARSSSN